MTAGQTIFNTQEAAKLLGVHIETIRRLVRKGNLPSFMMGNNWRFWKDSLLDWMEASSQNTEIISELIKTDPDLPIIIVTSYPDSQMMMDVNVQCPVMLVAKPINKKITKSSTYNSGRYNIEKNAPVAQKGFPHLTSTVQDAIKT